MLTLVIVISVLALVFAGYLTKQVLSRDNGTEAMQEIAKLIRIGANAFVKRQYTTIGILSVVMAIIIYAAYAFFGNPTLGWRT